MLARTWCSSCLVLSCFPAGSLVFSCMIKFRLRQFVAVLASVGAFSCLCRSLMLFVAVAASRRASCRGVSYVVSFLGVGHLRIVVSSSCLGVSSCRHVVMSSCLSSRAVFSSVRLVLFLFVAVRFAVAMCCLSVSPVSLWCHSHCHLSCLYRSCRHRRRVWRCVICASAD